MSPSRSKRILIASDSLGTPIHPRGIFHYTANLVRALRACGHQLTLLVETTGFHDNYPAAQSRHESIQEYLSRKEFVGTYQPSHSVWASLFQRLRVPTRALALLSTSGATLLLGSPKAMKTERVAAGSCGAVPQGLEHLREFTEFLASHAVYTLSSFASTYGLRPPEIDARGYDVVLVDTPSYFRFRTSPAADIVTVIHDLIPLTDPGMHPIYRRAFARKLGASLKVATGFLFVSEATRQDFSCVFPEAIRGKTGAILHPTVSGAIDLTAAERVERNGGAPNGRYFTVVASDEQRKNLDELVRALPMLPPDVCLLVVGHFTPSRQAAYGAIDPRVRFLGYVPEAVKIETVAGSLGLIMPSLSEGFGIPLIEAACLGKPVFCSDIPVFHEVLGENAFFFDPRSAASMADALRSYLEDPAKWRARIAAAQAECLRRFTLRSLVDSAGSYFGTAAGEERTGSCV